MFAQPWFVAPSIGPTGGALRDAGSPGGRQSTS